MSALLWVILLWIGAAWLLMGIYAVWFFFFMEKDKNTKIYEDEYNERLRNSRDSKKDY